MSRTLLVLVEQQQQASGLAIWLDTNCAFASSNPQTLKGTQLVLLPTILVNRQLVNRQPEGGKTMGGEAWAQHVTLQRPPSLVHGLLFPSSMTSAVAGARLA